MKHQKPHQGAADAVENDVLKKQVEISDPARAGTTASLAKPAFTVLDLSLSEVDPTKWLEAEQCADHEKATAPHPLPIFTGPLH